MSLTEQKRGVCSSGGGLGRGGTGSGFLLLLLNLWTNLIPPLLCSHSRVVGFLSVGLVWFWIGHVERPGVLMYALRSGVLWGDNHLRAIGEGGDWGLWEDCCLFLCLRT